MDLTASINTMKFLKKRLEEDIQGKQHRIAPHTHSHTHAYTHAHTHTKDLGDHK